MSSLWRCVCLAEQIPNWRFILNKIYPELRESSRKVADFLLDSDIDTLSMSITDLADSSGVSISTVQRLCREMGFKGFKEFKISIAQNWQGRDSVSVVEPSDNISTAKAKIFRSNIEAIENTEKILDESQLSLAIDLLKKAENISLFAIGGSGALASDASHKFLRIGVKCHCITDVDHQSKHAVLMTPKDVVIAISYSGRTVPLIENVVLAKECGAPIIAVTGYGKSPLSKLADVTLFSCSSESGFGGDLISKRVAQLTIIDTLFFGLSLTDYDKHAKYIEMTQRATSRFKGR